MKTFDNIRLVPESDVQGRRNLGCVEKVPIETSFHPEQGIKGYANSIDVPEGATRYTLSALEEGHSCTIRKGGKDRHFITYELNFYA